MGVHQMIWILPQVDAKEGKQEKKEADKGKKRMGSLQQS